MIVSCLQWEDAAEGEEDWETAEAEAPVNGSGAVGSFDIDASEEAGAWSTFFNQGAMLKRAFAAA